MRRQLDVRQQEVFASVERLHCSNSGGTADFIFVLNDYRSGRFFIYASNEPKSVLAQEYAKALVICFVLDISADMIEYHKMKGDQL